MFDRFVIPSLRVDIYINTCGLPASAGAIISGWGRFGNVGGQELTGFPRGEKGTHKVVIHQHRRHRNKALLCWFLIKISCAGHPLGPYDMQLEG